MNTETGPVRKGEEIDVPRLMSYLRANLDASVRYIKVEQFPGGSSNLTYLVRVQEAEYVLRRPPHGNTVNSAHDMRREFDVLSKLSIVYRPAPRPLLYCGDELVVGSEFYLMERRKGVVIRGAFPDVNTQAGSLRSDVGRAFIQNLADLHRIDPKEAGLESLGRAVGYNRRQVDGWAKRYAAARTHSHPDVDLVIDWLAVNVPPESGVAIIHNDYKFDNVMLDPDDLTRMTAVLDWEMVTIGDPLMDLGTTLGYWMSADAGDVMMNMPFNPRALMEEMTRQQLVDMYSEATGRTVPDMLFYYIFGTFKIAVIAQQIYARYAKGLTSDARFRHFDKFVDALARIAANALERGTI